MADEAVVATETPAEPERAIDAPHLMVLTSFQTDSFRADAGTEIDGSGLTQEQVGHLIAIGALHEVGVAPVVLPTPELMDPDMVRKQQALKLASEPEPAPSPVPEPTPAPTPTSEPTPEGEMTADLQRAAALNALIAQVAPGATVEQLAQMDALVESPVATPTPEPGA